jgi:geranylgeranyl diphosphate synthase type I
MRTEVTLGQYLDVLDERSWQSYPEDQLLARAHKVIVYKSAKYSIEAPLAIGAALGGADAAQVAALRGFGLPLGIAYQLRDDLLGVFGDPAVTGKPAGDDLREGKRTVLIALARPDLATSSRLLLDELLGDESLTDLQVRMLQASIVESGAVDKVERIIDHNVRLALAALDGAPISAAAQDQLRGLADTVTRRTA